MNEKQIARYRDSRCKFNHINNYTKCKWFKYHN